MRGGVGSWAAGPNSARHSAASATQAYRRVGALPRWRSSSQARTGRGKWVQRAESRERPKEQAPPRTCSARAFTSPRVAGREDGGSPRPQPEAHADSRAAANARIIAFGGGRNMEGVYHSRDGLIDSRARNAKSGWEAISGPPFLRRSVDRTPSNPLLSGNGSSP